MKSAGEWRQGLRDALKQAMKQRQADSVAVLRETLAAFDDAEAADLAEAPKAQAGVIAGGVAGLGAGDVARRVLSADDAARIIEREMSERRSAAATYASLGKPDEAARLTAQVALLESLR